MYILNQTFAQLLILLLYMKEESHSMPSPENSKPLKWWWYEGKIETFAGEELQVM